MTSNEDDHGSEDSDRRHDLGDQNAHHTRDGGSETTQGDCRKGNDGCDDHDRDEPPNEVDEGARKMAGRFTGPGSSRRSLPS